MLTSLAQGIARRAGSPCRTTSVFVPRRGAHGHRARVLDDDAVSQRHALPEAAGFAGGREAVGLQRGLDIAQALSYPGGAQAAPLERVVGQHAHVLLDLAAVDRVERRLMSGASSDAASRLGEAPEPSAGADERRRREP